MRTLEGNGSLVEDFIELSHQDSARYTRQFCGMLVFDQKHDAIHRAEEVKTNPGVAEKIKKMSEKKLKRKREKTLEREKEQKEKKVLKRESALPS